MLYVLIGLVLLILAAFLYVYVPRVLPQGAEEAADRALGREELPDLHPGRTGFADSNGVKIWFESLGNPKDPTILLIMGHSCTALVWPEYFWKPLVEAGYHVIRYDNRGLGLSDWVEDWEKDPSLKYNLEDMAKDGLAILDHLDIHKAHLIGVSMGGMIAQRIAISYPDRVLSLTSMLSSGYFFQKGLPDVMFRFKAALLRLVVRYRSAHNDRKKILMRMGIHEALCGRQYRYTDLDRLAVEALFEIRKRRGSNPITWKQHGYAIKKSGSRLEELKKVSCPALVIHGTDDPLVRIEHAHVYAPLIPGAQTLFIEDMGHVVAKEATPLMLEAILEMISPIRARGRSFRWTRKVGKALEAGKKTLKGAKTMGTHKK